MIHMHALSVLTDTWQENHRDPRPSTPPLLPYSPLRLLPLPPPPPPPPFLSPLSLTLIAISQVQVQNPKPQSFLAGLGGQGREKRPMKHV